MSKNNSYSTLSPFLNLPIVVNTNVILLELNTSGVGVASWYKRDCGYVEKQNDPVF
jgi:hypothetical protein